MSRVLRFVPISELAASAPPEPDWIWHGYLAAGTVTLLAGRPKVGKSTLVFGLVTTIAEGRDFCGRRTRASRVVLLSEERAGTFMDKLPKTALPLGFDVLLHQDAYDVAWPEIVRQASAHLGPGGLLVVDTLSDFAKLPADAENEAGAVQSAVRPLLEAAAGGCAVLVVAHQRKAAGEFGEAIRGSNALAAAVDVVLEFERAGSIGTEARVLKCVSRYRSGSGDHVLALGADGYEARGELAGAVAEAERERIFAQIALMDAPTAEDLAEQCGLSKQTALRHLHALQEAERVRYTGGGKKGDPYRWSPAFVSSAQDPGGRNGMARASAGSIRPAGAAKPTRPNGTGSPAGSSPGANGPMVQALQDLGWLKAGGEAP